MHRLLMERGRIIDTADRGQEDRRFRLGLPAGPRGLDDAGAGRAPRAACCPSTRSRASGASSSRPSPMCRRPTRSMRTSPAATRRCANSARFHFGFTVPFLSHPSAAAVIEAVAGSRGDLGIFRLDQGASSGAWWRILDRARQPQDHRPAALHRAARPSRPARRSSSSPSPWPTPRCATWCSTRRSSSAGTGARARPLRRLGGEVVASAADASGLSELIAHPGIGRCQGAPRGAHRGRREPRRARRGRQAMPNVSA